MGCLVDELSGVSRLTHLFLFMFGKPVNVGMCCNYKLLYALNRISYSWFFWVLIGVILEHDAPLPRESPAASQEAELQWKIIAAQCLASTTWWIRLKHCCSSRLAHIPGTMDEQHQIRTQHDAKKLQCHVRLSQHNSNTMRPDACVIRDDEITYTLLFSFPRIFPPVSHSLASVLWV